MKRFAWVELLVVAAVVSCFALAAVARAADEKVKLALTPERAAKLRDPIPDLKHTPTTLTPERVKWILQYGNLRMMTGLGQNDGTGLAEDIAAYRVTFITHSLGAAAISFCNRYKTVDQMRSNSLDRRGVFEIYHKVNCLALPYIDYQRCMRKPNAQTYDNWDKLRKEWEPVFGPLPENIDAMLEQDVNGKVISRERGQSFGFTITAPFTLMRACLLAAGDSNNGGDGNYCDNGYMSANGCFNPLTIADFRRWAGETFTAAQRQDLFGADDVAKLDLAAAVKDRQVTPLRVAWQHYKTWKNGWIREQLRAFGCTINPAYIIMSTYYSHAGAPFDPITSIAMDIEEVTKNGNRDSLLFWEPGTAGPSAGRTYGEEKAAAEKAGQKTWRFGRRSFSCSLKQMVGASFVPVVSKQSPSSKKGEDGLTELCMAESYANLVTPRTYKSSGYNQDAIKRLHAFQEAHADLFLGSQPYPRVALLCSTQQAYALRRDADAVPFSRKLLDLGLAHQTVTDRCLTDDGLKDFDLLFVFKAVMLSDAQIAALTKFAQRGAVILVGECGTHDEWNRPRAKPLALAAGAHVALIPDGPLTRWYGDFWYRHSDDGDIETIRKAVEATYGNAWPYLASKERSDRVEIHLAEIPKTGRICAHIVNYDVEATGATPAPAFELAIKLHGDKTPTKALFATPDEAQQPRPLSVKIETRNGARYAIVQVPSAKVYAIIAFD